MSYLSIAPVVHREKSGLHRGETVDAAAALTPYLGDRDACPLKWGIFFGRDEGGYSNGIRDRPLKPYIFGTLSLTRFKRYMTRQASASLKI